MLVMCNGGCGSVWSIMFIEDKEYGASSLIECLVI